MKLNFDNQFAALGEKFYAAIPARPLPNPRMVATNPNGAALLDLDPDDLQSKDALQFFSGAKMIDGADPLAMVYAGHQFGGYSPRLGDGRGLLLGQVRNQKNELWDIHLKGAGPSPFCRGADGRAVLRSSIREYLASEALHHLGIPTSRALCLIHSDEPVQRERLETAAGVIRLSETHVRFGSFEYFSYTNQHDELQALCDYTRRIHYPEVVDVDHMLQEIAGRTAEMIAAWQAFGFAHGVMNTDNMSILGQTFDYGPYGFMEAFDPHYICNHSDDGGRYAFDQQPNVGLWNCLALAHALKPLLADESSIEQMREHYQIRFFKRYNRLMADKLGLQTIAEGDELLVHDLFDLMAENQVDYTLFFRQLSDRTDQPLPVLKDNAPQFTAWFAAYDARLAQDSQTPEARRSAMRAINPKYILRNYLAQTAIEKAEQGDYSEIARLHSLLQFPFDDQIEWDHYASEPPDWGRHLDISCSS
ncbi:protein adenylyltransferase SelO [Paremcibacter congregatus]|uniref:Protein nucleotidyltransferase YdiU n=1 Tax=Paremcibacter congregatus TaxID=2043170 RepID=A0A2G4YS05_9PROT|nr:YdiU family protein [Paremcibacter congregatus]PHZ85050.1 hypothetical protein CRD36_10060 [Paremcibacter congregatus]QDE25974.1 YdiU family protein [Paremcibacter congregatus]